MRSARAISLALIAVAMSGVCAIVLAGTSRGATGNPIAGKTVFEANCAACHTFKAAASEGTIGPNLNTITLSQQQIIDAITNGGASVMTKAAAAKYSTQMVAYKGVLSTTQIDDTAAFIYDSLHPVTAAKPVTTHVTVTIGVPKAVSCKVSKTSVPVGTVIFTVVNEGKTSRYFEVNGKKTPLLVTHKSAKLTVVFSKNGSFTYNCIAKGTLKVT